jgi:hypothetical protein
MERVSINSKKVISRAALDSRRYLLEAWQCHVTSSLGCNSGRIIQIYAAAVARSAHRDAERKFLFAVMLRRAAIYTNETLTLQATSFNQCLSIYLSLRAASLSLSPSSTHAL